MATLALDFLTYAFALGVIAASIWTLYQFTKNGGVNNDEKIDIL